VEEPLPAARVEVVHVGAACRDIAPDDPRGWRLGGGVTYAALTTARLGLRTAAVVGVDAEAARASELDALRDAGVDILQVDLPQGPVFHNVETPHGREQTVIARGVPVRPVAMPASWVASPSWSLVPVAAEVDDEWAALIDPEAIVGVAWQGMLRRLVPGTKVERIPPSERAILRRADLVGVSHLDVAPETSLGTLTSFLHPGARLLVTQGGQGGLLVTTDRDGPVEVLRYLPTPTEREVDPTGAGDTFLAALLAVLVRPSVAASPGRSLARGLRFAAAAGSLAVEDLGLAGVPDRTAVLVRRARERVRRAVVPSLSAQVGVEDPRQ
jgi:sugar/nucleoside kinase (ribokinase family)